MIKNIIISGSGGQGILSIGAILANIALFSDKFVSYCPCYGAQMRGGAVNCEISFSDKELLCIQKEKAKFVVALNQQSFDKFISKVEKNGTIIANSTLIKPQKPREDISYIFAPITQEAIELGNIKTANSIALGILLNLLNEFSIENTKKAYEKVLKTKKNLIEKNIEALLFGFNFLKKEGN